MSSHPMTNCEYKSTIKMNLNLIVFVQEKMGHMK